MILLVLIVLNGVFSMSEIALVSARKTRLEAEAVRGDARAKAAPAMASAPNRFLSTVQIGITLIGILTGIYSGENITGDLEAILATVPFLKHNSHGFAVAGVVIIVTFFSLVLGELVPKRIGLAFPEPIAKMVAIPMRTVSWITAPFIWMLTASTEALLKVMRIKPRSGGGVTEDEIRAMVQEGAEGGEVQAMEQEIVDRMFTLGDRNVRSLMTHRRDLVYLDLNADPTTVRGIISRDMHGVYPVIDADPEKVVGVVTLKDLFTHLEDPEPALGRILRDPPWLPEGLSAYEALRRFKRTGQRYGLVTDEFGEAQGLVTLNDILEALVGDVGEFHGGEFALTRREDGSWLVDGHYPLHELLVRLGQPGLARDVEADTIGGLFLYQTGRIPVTGEKLRWMIFDLEVVDMDGVRIDKLLVSPVKD